MFFLRFTQTVECMFQLLKFFQKLDELGGKMTYENDPIKVKKTPLKEATENLLTRLLKRYTVTHIQSVFTVVLTLMHVYYSSNVSFSVHLWWSLSQPCLKVEGPWCYEQISSSQWKQGQILLLHNTLHIMCKRMHISFELHIYNTNRQLIVVVGWNHFCSYLHVVLYVIQLVLRNQVHWNVY